MNILGKLGKCSAIIALTLSFCSPARAQAGPTTGAIVGTVTDNSGSVVPGVKVTVSGPSLMGEKSVVTGAQGEYLIPVLPPGTYQLVFDMSGFGSVTRQNIVLSVGFTATINVQMGLATVSQQVMVTGASPVVDVTSTKITDDLSPVQIENLPSKADYGTILEITPGVGVGKADVGGSGAIAFTIPVVRYGISGQDRSEIDGLYSTESGGGGAEYVYDDVKSFSAASLTIIGNNAEQPMPGTLSRFVIKSGGSSYHGQIGQSFENTALETTNIDARQIALGVVGTPTFPAVNTNSIQQLSDTAGNVGGYVLKNKLWWFGGYRYERFIVNFENLLGSSQTNTLPVYTGKITYQLTPKNTLTAFYSEGIKHEDPSLYGTVVFPISAGETERWSSNVRGGSWTSLLSNSLVLQVNGGLFFERGDYFANDTTDFDYSDIGLNTRVGSQDTTHSTHYRWQLNGALSWNKTGWLGTHNFKFGGEFDRESNSSIAIYNGNIALTLNDGAPAQVTLYETPTTALNYQRAFGLYAEDSWQVVRRLTLNLGVRFDQHLDYYPSQTAPTGTIFPRLNVPEFNNAAARIGAVYALTKDNKTVLKTSFGQFWEDPFTSIASLINPNTTTSATYAWTPSSYPTAVVDGVTVPVFVPGSQGELISTSGTNPNGTAAVTVNPNLENSYLLQGTAYLEREVAPDFGLRTGFVWNAWRQAYGEVNTNEPYSAFDVPVTVTVPGPDGKLSDSTGTVTAYNLASQYVGLVPNEVQENLPAFLGNSNYYNWEVTATRRTRGRWSLMATFVNTWAREAPLTNSPGASGSYAYMGGAPPYNYPTIMSPNTLINTYGGQNHYTYWTAKVMSTINVWRGFELSPMFRSQSGVPFARSFNQKLNYNSAVPIFAEKFGAERLPTINIADLRTEKVFKVKERWNIDPYFALYNIFNTNATQSETQSSGSAFLRPTTITGPRIAAYGVNVNF